MQIISTDVKFLYYSCCHYRRLFWHHLCIWHLAYLLCLSLLSISVLSICLFVTKYSFSLSHAPSLMSSVLEEFYDFSSPFSLYWFQFYRSDLHLNKYEQKARNLKLFSVLRLQRISPSELFFLRVIADCQNIIVFRTQDFSGRVRTWLPAVNPL